MFTYVLLRQDLGMTAGKAAAQACHAARLSLLTFLQSAPERADEFLSRNSCGSVVVLTCAGLAELERTALLADRHALPCAVFVDSGHVMPPGFDGSPIPTALAIGPAAKAAIRPLLRAYRCL